MAHSLINRALYDAIVRFDEDEAAQEYYYWVMDRLGGLCSVSLSGEP